MDNELLETILDTLEVYDTRINKLVKEAPTLVSKEVKTQVALMAIDITKDINSSIRTPKDGVDGKTPEVDYKLIENLLQSNIDKSIQLYKSDIESAVPSAVKTYVDSITIPKKGDKGDKGDRGDSGIDGKDGVNGLPGIAGKDGVNGKDGKDGTSVDIKRIESLIDRKLKSVKASHTDQQLSHFNATPNPVNISKTQVLKWVSEEGGGGGDVFYTNLNPVPNTVGGITSGSTFSNKTVQEMFDALLYPYQNPSFTSFSIAGLSNLNYEVGYTFPEGIRTFNWGTSNSENIKPDSVTLNGISGLANDFTEDQFVDEITRESPSSFSFSISAENTNNATFNRTLTLNWRFRRFWGVSPNPEVDDVEILSWSNELATNRSKTITYDCSGGNHFYIAYPQSFGDMDSTTINSLAWNDWVLVKRVFVNVHGVEIPFNIYRSFNLLNGTITVNWG